jgi:hypothetical protein
MPSLLKSHHFKSLTGKARGLEFVAVGAQAQHRGLGEQYLTAALVKHSGGASLRIHSVVTIGTGQMAESYRVVFAPGSHGNMRDSVVVKVPSQSESSRGASRVTRCYELETSFYNSLQHKVGVHAPQCMHVWYDAPDDDFVLVLEDIADAAQGDQLQGATIEQASAAINQLVALHASLWNSPELDDITWAGRHTPESAAGTRDLLQGVFNGFAKRFAGSISPEVMQLGETFVDRIDGYDAAYPSNQTIIHRDFRLDNLLFSSSDASVVRVVDWQTVAIGPGAHDLGYFIGASFPTDTRRKVEEQLMRQYHEGISQANIQLSWQELWDQYRLFATSGYIMAIVASMLVKQTDRGDAMFAAMANRHGQQMLDLQTIELFH